MPMTAKEEPHPTKPPGFGNCPPGVGATADHTYLISLHSSSRSSSDTGSDSEDFEEAAAEMKTWYERRQSNQKASSLEDQDEATKRVIIKRVNSIFLKPTGPMMPRSPLMPMVHFMQPSVGPTDMPRDESNESCNPNYNSRLPSNMPHPHDSSESKDPQNVEVNACSDPLAPPTNRHVGSRDLKETGGNEECAETGTGDKSITPATHNPEA